jgi:hypothetical protein
MFRKSEDFLAFSIAASLAATLAVPVVSATPDTENDAPATVAATSRLDTEVREVKKLLRAQQQRIEALEAELRLVRTSVATTTSAELEAAKASDRVGRPREVPEKGIDTENRLKTIGPLTLSGDLRVRDEPFFDGPRDQSLVRNRERFRLRFNANANLGDDLRVGFSLSTGDVNDPISTNQTLNQFYTRKPIAVDKAFINYRPNALKTLTLIGGKFAYPWCNTELTWDKDLNPEGLAQILSWNFERTPALRKMALIGFELPFTEVAGTALANQSIVQSVAYGGQLQTAWEFASWLRFSAYGGFDDFHNADPIALALAGASSKNPQTPFLGLLSLGSGGNTIQNSITTTAATTIVTVNETAYPTGIKTVTNAQFASKFGLLDAIARFDVKTRFERWPIVVIGDYVQNTRACANVSKILVAPANTPTVKYAQSVSAPCVSRERRGYWGEARFGRTQQRGDWQLAYTRILIEREAVLGSFNFSDMRQGSNVTEHRLEAFYQTHRDVQLGFTALIGRPLNWNITAAPEPFLKRLQFDVVYKF